jgi:hypothetical protein
MKLMTHPENGPSRAQTIDQQIYLELKTLNQTMTSVAVRLDEISQALSAVAEKLARKN